MFLGFHAFACASPLCLLPHLLPCLLNSYESFKAQLKCHMPAKPSLLIPSCQATPVSFAGAGTAWPGHSPCFRGSFWRRTVRAWFCSPPWDRSPGCAWCTEELSKHLNNGRTWRTFLLWSTADGEGVPLVARDGGDVQIQVVARPVVEKWGPLDEEMSHLGKDRHHSSAINQNYGRCPLYSVC